MSIVTVVVHYVLLIVSFLVVAAVFRKKHKGWFYTFLAVDLAAAILFSVLLISENQHPSGDANIGLGLSILLVEFVSTAGFLAVVIDYIVKRAKK